MGWLLLGVIVCTIRTMKDILYMSLMLLMLRFKEDRAEMELECWKEMRWKVCKRCKR